MSKAEADAIETRIAELERATGVQVVTAIVGRSDDYPELAWKAFALGAAVAALVVLAFDLARPDWMLRYAAWSNVAPILGIAAANALLALVLSPYARLYLNRVHAAREVRRRAHAMFFERELFGTRARNGLLVFASVFERRVEVVADVGFHGRVAEHEWHSVIEAMTPLLAGAHPAEAFARGIERLQVLLGDKGFAGHDERNELPDRPIVGGDAWRT